MTVLVAVASDETALRDVAHTLRLEATRLRKRADFVQGQADRIEAALGEVLTGPQAAERLVELVAPGIPHHYSALAEVLRRAGLVIRGADPEAVLLMALSRSPVWEQSARRSGIYQRRVVA